MANTRCKSYKMKYAIEFKNITKSFGGLKALDNLSVGFPFGKTTGLIGPNGSGKTTLINILTGILSPDCGEIKIDNSSYSHIEPTNLRKLKIARTFQDGRLIGQSSVKDNLMLAIAETKILKSFLQTDNITINDKIDNILKKLNMHKYKNVLVEKLSYGQRKLIELGRAIIQDADIYLLDEPFTGLFPKMVTQVSELINELKSENKTIVIIEHNMTLTRKLCDNIIVLDHGQLLATGKPDNVLQDKSVQQAYLGV